MDGLLQRTWFAAGNCLAAVALAALLVFGCSEPPAAPRKAGSPAVSHGGAGKVTKDDGLVGTRNDASEEREDGDSADESRDGDGDE